VEVVVVLPLMVIQLAVVEQEDLELEQVYLLQLEQHTQ
jgi:hypothetical protein